MSAKFHRKFSIIRYLAWIGMTAFGLAMLQGCETAKRFAPPGFFKYEDREKGIPANIEIQQRVQSQSQSEDAKFPKLSDEPQTLPKGIGRRRQANYVRQLEQLRAELQSAMNTDRAALAEDFELDKDGNPVAPKSASNAQDIVAIADRIRALEVLLAEDRQAADKELQDRLPAPLDTSAAPEPEEP